MADDKLTIGDLKKYIQDTVSEVVGGIKDTKDDAHDKAQKHTEDKLDRPSSIADQVQQALDKLRSKEAADEKEKNRESQIADLLKRTEEKPPVERGRMHRVMGWGE